MKCSQFEELIGLGSDSVLVIGKSGLRRFYCPLRVMCVRSINVHAPGDVLFVDKVKLSKDMTLSYKIGSFHYAYQYFEIIGY